MTAGRIRDQDYQSCCDSPCKWPSHRSPWRVKAVWCQFASNFERASELMFGRSNGRIYLSDGEVTGIDPGIKSGCRSESYSMNRVRAYDSVIAPVKPPSPTEDRRTRRRCTPSCLHT